MSNLLELLTYVTTQTDEGNPAVAIYAYLDFFKKTFEKIALQRKLVPLWHRYQRYVRMASNAVLQNAS